MNSVNRSAVQPPPSATVTPSWSIWRPWCTTPHPPRAATSAATRAIWLGIHLAYRQVGSLPDRPSSIPPARNPCCRHSGQNTCVLGLQPSRASRPRKERKFGGCYSYSDRPRCKVVPMAGGSGGNERRSPMLSVCTERDCTAIVFGRGTCTDHDQHPVVPGAPERRRMRDAPRCPEPGQAAIGSHDIRCTLAGSESCFWANAHPHPSRSLNRLVQLRRHSPTFRGLRRRRDLWKPLHAIRGRRLGNALRPVEPDLPLQLLRARSLRND